MAKIKYDASNAEVRKQPKPGVYKCKIHSMADRTPQGKNDIETILEVMEGEFKGSRIWNYLNLGEQSAWKLREFTDALGLKPKGTLDTDRLKGKAIGVVVKADSWNDEYRARVNKFISVDEIDEDDEEEDFDDEVEDDEDLPVDDDDDDDEDDDDEDDDDEEDEIDYASLSIKELRAIAKEKGIESKKKADILAELAKLDEDDDDDEDDNDDEDDEDEPDVDEDEDEDEDDDEEEDDDDEDAEDYSSWSIEELKEELDSRGLQPKGKKSSLIARLERDDASDSKPF